MHSKSKSVSLHYLLFIFLLLFIVLWRGIQNIRITCAGLDNVLSCVVNVFELAVKNVFVFFENVSQILVCSLNVCHTLHMLE